MLGLQKNLKILTVQYELAMLTGHSLDIKKMLAEFLPKTLSILNCVSGHVWLYKTEDSANQCIYSYPKANADYIATFQYAVNQFYIDFSKSNMKKRHDQRHNEKSIDYFFMMGDMGVIVLQTRFELSDEMISALHPIFSRLGIACHACLQYGIKEMGYQDIFDHSPVGLCEVDCSELKNHLNALQASGKEIESYLKNIEVIQQLHSLIKVNNANFFALKLFHVKEKSSILFQGQYDKNSASLTLLYKIFISIAANEKNFSSEGMINLSDGDVIHVSLTYSVLPSYTHSYEKVLFSIVDITKLKKVESHLEFLSKHDVLTGLPNRIVFHTSLDIAMKRADRTNETMALLYIDIDNFKSVNDEMGHAIGDKLLTEVGKNLQSLIRADDCVARIGGDEFIIVLNGVGAINNAKRMVDNIQKQVSRSYHIGKNNLDVSVSVGVAFYPEKNESYVTLQKHADIALYHAKASGRNCVRYHEPHPWR